MAEFDETMIGDEEDQEAFMVSSRVADQQEVAIPGSTQEPCHLCGQNVWLSPASKSVMLDHGPMKLTCLQCIAALKVDDPNPEVMPPDSRQVHEMLKYFFSPRTSNNLN
jgi:hypothetical protein